MTKDLFIAIQNGRSRANKTFKKEFEDAKTPSELLQAYARYAGALEAILDGVEVRSREEGLK